MAKKEKDEIKEGLKKISKEFIKPKKEFNKTIDVDEMIEIIPKKDFILVDGYRQFNLKEGVSINIPKKFKGSLESEKII